MMRCPWLCLLGLLAPSFAKWQPISDHELEAALRENGHTLVAYISTKAEKKFEDFQDEWSATQDMGENENIVSLDCAAHQQYCHESDIVSFPTIRLYHKDGHFDRYRGPRKAKDIIAYLHRMSRPIMSTLDNKNASTFKSADDIVLIANLIEGKDGGLEERITQVAKQYHDRYSFGIYRRKKGHGVSLDCINNANFEQSSVTDLSDPLAIDNLIRQCAAPLIPAFTRRNEGDFAKTGKSMVHYLTSSDEDRESYISAMRALAKKYKEFLIFVTTDVSEYPDLLTMTGHRAGSESVLSVIKPNNAGSVFPYRGEHITPETVEAFLTEISSGKVKPWDGTWPEEEEEAGKSEQDSKRDEL